jgi:cobalamin biosynthesis protein CobD/CbiB
LTPLVGTLGRERVVWIGILVVAVLEPFFQVLFEKKPFTWGAAYTWVHVFAIAFLQLYVFRRFDFVTMYAFRLIYYAYWHILWGVIRLNVLF